MIMWRLFKRRRRRSTIWTLLSASLIEQIRLVASSSSSSFKTCRCVSLTWEGCPDNASKRKDDLHLTTDSTLHKFLTTRLSDWEAAELHSCRNEKSVRCKIFARKDVELYWYHKPGASYLLMLLIKTTLYRLQHHTQSPKVQRALESTRRCD